MARFVKCGNNAVVAVMTSATYEKYLERCILEKEILEKSDDGGKVLSELTPIGPIFTFSHPDHPSIKFMTGTFGLLERLFAHQQNLEVVRETFYVPFSNKRELLGDQGSYAEMMHMTTGDDLIEAFGIELPEPVTQNA